MQSYSQYYAKQKYFIRWMSIMCTNNNVKPFHRTCLWVYKVQKHLGVCYMPPNIVLFKLRYTGFPERIKLGYVGHGTSPTTQKIWCEHDSAENQVQQRKCELKPDFKCKKPGRLSNTILSLTRNVWKLEPNQHDEEAWAFFHHDKQHHALNSIPTMFVDILPKSETPH